MISKIIGLVLMMPLLVLMITYIKLKNLEASAEDFLIVYALYFVAIFSYSLFLIGTYFLFK